jgi:hypothetical protein
MNKQQPSSVPEKLVGILTQHKDRFLKTSQYVVLFVSWYYQSRNVKLQEEKYYQMYKAIFNARRMFRLGHWITFIRNTLNSQS